MRILCLGDSMTAGMTRSVYHPPSLILSRLLPDHDFVNEGIPGDVAGRMADRLGLVLSNSRQEGCPIDVAIVWGGTNDLRLGSSASAVEKALSACVRAGEEGGAAVVVATVVEMSFEKDGDGTVREERERVNEAVRAGLGGCGTHGVADVAAGIPSMFGEPKEGSSAGSSVDQAVKDKWFCDGLHLTKAGYEKAGEIMGDALRKGGFLNDRLTT